MENKVIKWRAFDKIVKNRQEWRELQKFLIFVECEYELQDMDTTEQEVDTLIEIAFYVLECLDYSTPTGVGNALYRVLIDSETLELKTLLEDRENLKELIVDSWIDGDWK